MKSFAALTLISIVANAMHVRAEDAPVVGGWGSASLDEAKSAYYDAIKSIENFPTSNTTLVCATEFVSAQQQNVAGTNYKVTLKGCPVSSIAETTATCKCATESKPYTITVYKRLEGSTLVTLVAEGANAKESSVLPGGYSTPRAVTEADKLVYVKATSDEANFGELTIPRVCPTDYITVSTQVVAGTNYLFTVKGCSLDKADSKSLKSCASNCASKSMSSYQVKIYEDLAKATKVLDAIPAASKTGAFVALSDSGASTTLKPSSNEATPPGPTPTKASSASAAKVALAACVAAYMTL